MLHLEQVTLQQFVVLRKSKRAEKAEKNEKENIQMAFVHPGFLIIHILLFSE